MKRRVSIRRAFILMLAATSWASVGVTFEPPRLREEALTDACTHVGRIISIQGEVQLKRQTWADYHPTSIGAELCLGDWLQPTFRARVTVQCADPTQNLWTVPNGKASGASEGCRPPNPPLPALTRPITPTRDPLASGTSVIIGPSNTWLLNDRPTLRWVPVAGVTSYVVRVTGPWVKWVREVNNATHIVYPGQPPLKPVEEGYLLTVEADNGEVARTTFGLLDEKKATLVKAAAKQITGQKLNADEKNLALVELYIGQGLIAEATELLEAAVARGSQTAAIYYILGNLYSQVELFLQAERNYLKAAKLATTAKDTEGQAAAAARLGEIYTILGKSDQANHWLKEAKEGYQALGKP